MGVLTLCAAGLLTLVWWQLPVPHMTSPPAEHVAYAWPDPVLFPLDAWTVMQRRSAVPTASGGPLAQRFRLAGTFFAYPGENAIGEGMRQAIIDDLGSRRQFLSREGDKIDEVEVVGIFRDRIVLRSNGAEEELWLSFTDVAGDRDVSDGIDAVAEPPRRIEDMPAIETSRFGKRVGENRWVIQRDELVRYADEVLEDPERLLALFAAMEPDLNEADEIAGFRLGMLGENVLYEAAGMQDGDVVRAVNSMPMTSPARARYFITEFMNGRISAIVLDIERDGEEQKLIHLIR